MSEGKEERPVHIFRSNTTADTVKIYWQRFDRSGPFLSGFYLFFFILGSIVVFGSAGALSFFFFPPCGVILILFGLVIDVALVYIAIRKKDISKGSKDYYIESFSDHLDLHSEVKEPKTIAFSDILRMERFSRELKKFKDNNISADFEQAEYPCIHIATGNDHLYKLTYAQGKKKKEVIVDIYDVEQFELIVFQGDSKFKGPREIVKKNFIKLTCPRCDHDFDVDADTRVLECPKCGVKGDL